MRVLAYLVLTFAALGASVVRAQSSVCYGKPSQGSISNAVQLPSSGPNFEAYSAWGASLGRNYVHSMVARVMLATYTEIQNQRPELSYVYGETGWKQGG